MTIEPTTYDDIPEPAFDDEAAEALAESAAGANPDADAETAIANARDRAHRARLETAQAVVEARAFGLAASRYAYDGPASAAKTAADAAGRAADRATAAWRAAYEAADDAAAVAWSAPAEAALVGNAAADAATNARLARRAAYEARLEAKKAEAASRAALGKRMREQGAAHERMMGVASDQGAPAPAPARSDQGAPPAGAWPALASIKARAIAATTGAEAEAALVAIRTEAAQALAGLTPPAGAELVASLLREAHAAFDYLAMRHPIEADRTAFAERRDKAAAALRALGAWPPAEPG